MTLQDVHIQPDSKGSSDPAPIEIKGNGNTNLELNGDNIVLSGMFLLAAGFVLDRKNRRMN